MAFMMKKKKYRFNVEVKLQDLENVALVNEVLFAKIRLLDGGSFQEYSSREEVRNHRVEWNRNFEFPCKMSANASTGVLDPCYLRISIRKEMKGGRSYYKLGFIDLNLAEYAGAGLTSRRFLLEGYDSRHRLDNSMLTLSIKMLMLSGDILFKAPTPNLKKQKTPTDDLTTAATGVSGLQSPTSLTSSSLPTIGVTTRPVSTIRDDDSDPQYVMASIVTDSGHSESSESAITLTPDALLLQQQLLQQQQQQQTQQQQQQTHLPSSYPPSSVATLVPGVTLTNAQQMLPYGGIGGTGGSGGGGIVVGGSGLVSSGSGSIGIIGSNNCGTTASISGLSTSAGGSISGGVGTVPGLEMGHSRNSSNTSQMSKGSGYSSFSHSQHSRQSSEGDSGHARFSKSVSLLNRLNQRAINAMKLHIPALIHHNPPAIDNVSALILQTEPNHTTTTHILHLDENEELMFQTPNSSVREELGVDDFRTPLNEMPSPPPLSANSVYNMKLLNTPSPTYRSVNSNSRSCSRESDIYGSGERDSESETADDSGLDENFHTPRVAKIKSMENLSILEMEFHKASQELDRNSPRRLKWLAERERIQMPKMKSLNNLCFDNYSEEQMRAEFQMIREQNLEEKLRFNMQQRKNSTSSSNSGKLYIKNTKVGNAKFIGNDDNSPITQITNHHHHHHQIPHPIQKMRSMGTIPDLVSERIEADPFLTPTSARKPQFPLVTQSAEKAGTPSYAAARLLTYDSVDGPGPHINHSYNSLSELYSQDRLGKLIVANDQSFMSRTPFERAYRRSLMKSSTPLRQSLGLIQQYNSTEETCGVNTQQQQQYTRPHSNNVAYDLMSSGSLVISETGSLDRMKNTAEKRKKGPLDDGPRVSDRVEQTRVNPNSLIDELLKNTNLDQLEETAETSGLQLFIGKDGTTSLGKSRATDGNYKQVVMANPR